MSCEEPALAQQTPGCYTEPRPEQEGSTRTFPHFVLNLLGASTLQKHFNFPFLVQASLELSLSKSIL